MRLPASPLKRTTVPSVTLGAGHAANRECWSVSDSQELHVGGRAGCVFGEGLPRIVTARKYSDRSCIGNRGLCEQHNGQGASIRTSERRHERLKHLCVIGQPCKHSIGNVGWVGARVLGHGRAGRSDQCQHGQQCQHCARLNARLPHTRVCHKRSPARAATSRRPRGQRQAAVQPQAGPRSACLPAQFASSGAFYLRGAFFSGFAPTGWRPSPAATAGVPLAICVSSELEHSRLGPGPFFVQGTRYPRNPSASTSMASLDRCDLSARTGRWSSTLSGAFGHASAQQSMQATSHWISPQTWSDSSKDFRCFAVRTQHQHCSMATPSNTIHQHRRGCGRHRCRARTSVIPNSTWDATSPLGAQY